MRQLCQTGSGSQQRLRDQLGALDVVDVPLRWLANVDEGQLLARVEQLTQLLRSDGLGRILGYRAAKRLVVDQFGDLRPRRLRRVFADRDGAVVHFQCVVDHQPAEQRFADAGDQFDGLGPHHRRDGRADDAEHAALGAGRHRARWRRLRVQVAVVQTQPARSVFPEHRDLSLEAVDRAPYIRLAGQHRGVVDQIPGGEVVGAVQDQVVLFEQLDGIAPQQPVAVAAGARAVVGAAVAFNPNQVAPRVGRIDNGEI